MTAILGARRAALGLHKEIPHPKPDEAPKRPGKCERWPLHMRLLNETTGEIIEGRCKSANLCAHCRAMARLENTELLHLDAMDGNAPRIWLVLGTRTATLESSVFDDGVRLVMRALRRRWPACEYVAMVEYTTGYGPRSGGLRRPHLNVALKGVGEDDLEQVKAIAARVWCQHLDAKPEAQFAGLINDGPGLFKYWADHFAKKGQEPPAGWRGHRLRMSRGYLSLPTPEARQRARASLAWKRALWRAEHVVGLSGEAIVDYALAQQEAAEAASWRLIDLEGVRRAHARRESARRPPAERGPAASAPAPRSAEVAGLPTPSQLMATAGATCRPAHPSPRCGPKGRPLASELQTPAKRFTDAVPRGKLEKQRE